VPIHDWTRVDAGIFHDFHHEWISQVKRALNDALAGTGYYALAEQVAGDFGPDVLTLKAPPGMKKKAKSLQAMPSGSLALATAPPNVRFHITDPAAWYAGKKKSVTVRHVSEHRIVACFEIVSPGNKSSRSGIDAFERKARALLAAGVHMAIVDLFPPTPRDPDGIHPIVWDDDGTVFHFDPAKPLTCASYVGVPGVSAFVEPVAVGDALPDLPLFIRLGEYVPVPLEATYEGAFEDVPEFWREALTGAKG
jgi:hypothetical protein